MTYDLAFWKEKLGVTADPQGTYERLSSGESVDGLDVLPIVAMIASIQEAFPADWTQIDDQNWEAPDDGLEIFANPQFLRVDCVGIGDEEIQALRGIATEFTCPLFDPQTGERFALA